MAEATAIPNTGKGLHVMMRRNRGRTLVQHLLGALVLLCLIIISLDAPRHAIALNRTVGNGADGSCTETTFDVVLSIANDGDTIDFNCGPTDSPIVVTDWKVIDFSLIIDGGDDTTLSGDNTTALFWVDLGGDLTLRNITLTAGQSDGFQEAGAVLVDGSFTLEDSSISDSNSGDYDGGAIENYGEFTVVRSVISGSRSDSLGGGIDNFADATIVDSDIVDNSAGVGSGIFNWGSLIVRGSTISGNSAVFDAGGIENVGTADLLDTTISGNSAPFGGGLVNDGLLEAERVTISDNEAEIYAGFANLGGADIRNSTISGNTSDIGAAVANSISCGCAKMTLAERSIPNPDAKLGKTDLQRQPSIVADPYLGAVADLDLVDSTVAENTVTGGGVAIYNTDDLDLKGVLIANPGSLTNCDNEGRLTSGGYNLVTDSSCDVSSPTDRISGKADIAPLADNDGLTQTHALLSTSHAIDTNAFCSATDQRGVARPRGNSCDIGAFESAFSRDVSKPTTTPPTRSFTAAGIGSPLIAIEHTWTGADTGGSGIASYQLQRRVDGGRWRTVRTLTSTDSTVTESVRLVSGRSFEVRVRATDAAGNVGLWSAITAFTLSLIEDDDASIEYADPGHWRTVTGTHLSGGSMHYVANDDSTATVTEFTGNSIAWIGATNTLSGTALVRVDSLPWQYVDLSSATPETRRTIFQADGLADGQHTLSIKTLEDKRVNVDAFVVID